MRGSVSTHESFADGGSGSDGTGRRPPPGSQLEPAPHNFTDCTIVTTETTANWAGLVRHGGPFLGLSPSMPAFGDSLSDAEIDAVIAHLRRFCTDPRYPIGDLNFRQIESPCPTSP